MLAVEHISRFRCPPRILDRLYGSRYARHFYTSDELAGSRARWEG